MGGRGGNPKLNLFLDTETTAWRADASAEVLT